VVRYVDHRNPRDFDLEFPVDGAILIDVFDKSCLEGVEKAGIPYVVINGACRERGLSIRVDERVGMELLLDHLTGIGHERIAYANRNDSNALWRHPSILERETHYLEGMRPRPLPASQPLVR
jgi:DNA-binding LacI/PurR family transcriptional regulator